MRAQQSSLDALSENSVMSRRIGANQPLLVMSLRGNLSSELAIESPRGHLLPGGDSKLLGAFFCVCCFSELLAMAEAAVVTPRPALGRVHKRVLSDQQKRRDLALHRQLQARHDSQRHARHVVSFFVDSSQTPISEEDRTPPDFEHQDATLPPQDGAAGLLDASKLKGSKARQWFKQQFMLPEWMVDVPMRLRNDWYVLARPAGQRCIVVSSNGTTVSRLRNGRMLHHFPSALPNGARIHGSATSSHVFCILDCTFHELDNTYYVTDMMCWRGYSLYDCNYEFRYFWMNSKLGETGACDPPSAHHRYRFSVPPVYECDASGLQAAYSGTVPFERDGCLFMNRHAYYVLGITPLALLWKDSLCSRYYIDTDSKGVVPNFQQVVLELQDDGTVGTSDEPSVVLGRMPQEFLEQNKEHLRAGMLLRFAIGEQGLKIVSGRPVAADIKYQGLANRSRAGADSVSKILFQYAARHSPLTISDLLAASESCDIEGDMKMDV